MRINSTLFIFLLFFSSCATYYKGSLFTYSKNSFSSIPLRSHTNEVDAFLDNEKPSKPYYRIKMIEVQAGPELSSDAMLKLLKQKASGGTITLVYGARDQKHNEALVLKQFLEKG